MRTLKHSFTIMLGIITGMFFMLAVYSVGKLNLFSLSLAGLVITLMMTVHYVNRHAERKDQESLIQDLVTRELFTKWLAQAKEDKLLPLTGTQYDFAQWLFMKENREHLSQIGGLRKVMESVYWFCKDKKNNA
jgi:hypothetical protein